MNRYYIGNTYKCSTYMQSNSNCLYRTINLKQIFFFSFNWPFLKLAMHHLYIYTTTYIHFQRAYRIICNTIVACSALIGSNLLTEQRIGNTYHTGEDYKIREFCNDFLFNWFSHQNFENLHLCYTSRKFSNTLQTTHPRN